MYKFYFKSVVNNINFLLEVAKFYVQFFSGKKGPPVCGHFVTNFCGGQVAFGEVESNYYNNYFASTFCYERTYSKNWSPYDFFGEDEKRKCK